MIEAGIGDPESKEGKDFCTEKCPYPKCIVFEVGRGAATLRKEARVAKAKAMAAEGYPEDEIAQVLKVSVRSVEGYLEK